MRIDGRLGHFSFFSVFVILFVCINGENPYGFFFNSYSFAASLLPASSNLAKGDIRRFKLALENRIRNQNRGSDPIRNGLFDPILVNDIIETCYASLKKILGLDESTDVAYQTSTKNADIPVGHSVFEMDQKVLIKCGATGLEKPSNSLCPKPDKRVNMYAIDPFADGLKGVQQLQNPTY